jgi:hypothetical protein
MNWQGRGGVPVMLHGAERLALARAAGAPPYVVAHDVTLAEIASEKPRSASELARLRPRELFYSSDVKWTGSPSRGFEIGAC